jgi:hypothetical protein
MRILSVSLCHFALRLPLCFRVLLHGLLLILGRFLGSAGLGFGGIVSAGIDGNGAANAQASQDEKGRKSFHKVPVNQILAMIL